MRRATRAALVASPVAILLALALLVAPAGAARQSAASTFVFTGRIVQFIAPAGSTTGSLSLRVTRAPGARRLVGELVTVAISTQVGQTSAFAPGSLWTVALHAPGTVAVLKGAGKLQTIAPVEPPAPQTPNPAAPPAGPPKGPSG